MKDNKREKKGDIRKKSILIVNILITLILVLCLNFNILNNISYAEGDVVYQKKVEILSTPDIDTKGKKVTAKDRDVYEEEQKEADLKKEAEKRRNILKDDQNIYIIIVVIVIFIIVIISIMLLKNRSNKVMNRNKRNVNKNNINKNRK